MTGVPVVNDIKVVYGDQLGDAEERYARLIATFEEQYGGKPDLLARSPGRVNLIGEHIDYEGYSVPANGSRPGHHRRRESGRGL